MKSMLRLIVAVGILAGVAILAVANEHHLARYFKPPWMSECERLEARCKYATETGSDLGGALVCAGAGVVNAFKKSEDVCRKGNETLDDRSASDG